ncbi:MAG: hypothetical protein AAB225_23920 [Acidobacteriota bacterium]
MGCEKIARQAKAPAPRVGKSFGSKVGQTVPSALLAERAIFSRLLRICNRQTLCRTDLAERVICRHHCIQGIAPMYIQCHGQLHGIQSAEPAGIAMLLEESLGLSVMMLRYRNHG